MDEKEKNHGREIYKVNADVVLTRAHSDYQLFCFGKRLADEKGYADDKDGNDLFYPIRAYLIDKHHWTPSEVKSMSSSDLSMALTLELREFFLRGEEKFGWADSISEISDSKR